MAHRLRSGLLLLGVAAAVVVTGLLVLGPGSEKGPVGPPTGDDGPGGARAGGRGPGSPVTLAPGGRGTVGPDAGPGGGAPPVRPWEGGAAGLRVPEGVDLSDPRQVEELMRETLGEGDVDWDRMAQLMAVHTGRLDDDLRGMVLEALRTGNRVGALRVLSVARDGTLTQDLLGILDGPDLAGPARAAVLRALGTLPGANDAEVVRGIEARLTGNPREDVVALQAIGSRGGREGTRAIVEYLSRTEDPDRLASFGTLGLDLAGDAQASELVAAALAGTRDPEQLKALVRLSAQPGAEGLVDGLVALDVSESSPELRNQVLATLSQIGTASAVEHLLRVAEQPGTLGGQALQNLGMMRSATPQARAELVGALQKAPAGDTRTRVHILRALGNLGERSAIPAMAEALRDADEGVQQAAISGMGNMGVAAQDHVGDLLDLLGTGSESTQRLVAAALGGIGGEQARKALDEMSTSDVLPSTVVRSARMALQRLKREDGAGG